MGNDAYQLNRYDIACFYRKQDWIRLSISPRFQLWKHKYTQETAEVYMLENTPSPRDMDCYEFRSKQSDLVKVYFIDINHDTALCDNNNRIRLIVEHIPFRLLDIQAFTQEVGLAVLETALRGFGLMEREFGPVYPKEELIGFNSHGKTKVWLNKRIQLNNIQPQQSRQERKSKEQGSRIHKLYLMIEQKTAGQLLPVHIKEQLLAKDIKFDKALAIVRRFAYCRALSLSRIIHTGCGELRNAKNSAHLKHTRHNTNTSLSTKYNQTSHPLELSRKQSATSLQELPQSYNITQLDRRFDRDPRSKHRNIKQSTFILGSQCLNSNYSFSNTIHSQYAPSASATKVSFVHPVASKVSSLHSAEAPLSPQFATEIIEGQRKYTIIQKIEAEQSVSVAEKQQQNIQQKSNSLELTPSKEIFLPKNKIQDVKPQEVDKDKYAQVDRQICFQENKHEALYHHNPTPEIQHSDVRVHRIESLDQIEYNNIYPELAQQKRQQIVTVYHTQDKVRTSLAVTPKQIKSDQQDFLDINFLEKSLDRKFKHHTNTVQHAPIEDDILNIHKLQEGLIKFQQHQQNNSKQSPNIQNQIKIAQPHSKVVKCPADGDQEMTSKCIEVDHPLKKRQQAHVTFQAIEVQTQPVQSSYYFSSVRLQSIKAEANLFQFSFSSFSNLQQTNYSQEHNKDYRRYNNCSWSNEDMSMNYCNNRHRKYNSKTDLQEKYLKHVKSKDKFVKKMPTTNHDEYLNWPPSDIGTTLDRKNGLKKDQADKARKITYEDLRSLLRTDL